jgi:GH24 family phage-related lysozyme (muramidase)
MVDWPVTTYPGSHYLIRKLLSPRGCAILKEGQYAGVYQIDLHRGVYPALCQRLGNVSVYRDKNKDRRFDLDPATVITGEFGINCHAPITPSSGKMSYIADVVGSSSAGCLVFKKVADFNAFMDLLRLSKANWGNVFTVTLIRDKNLTATPDPVTPPAKPSSPGPISQDGIDLIKHFESCLKPVGDGMFEAYADPAHGWKVPTIGWGTIQYPNGKMVKQGDRITQAQADEYLAWEIGEKTLGVLKLVKVEINDDQLAALVSFAYNLGTGALAGSTLLEKLNAGDYAGAAEEFPRWNKAGGRTLLGLTRRRLSERKLFLSKRPFIVTLDELRS